MSFVQCGGLEIDRSRRGVGAVCQTAATNPHFEKQNKMSWRVRVLALLVYVEKSRRGDAPTVMHFEYV